MLVSDKVSEFWVNAERLIEIMLSGSDLNHPGAYIPTPRQAIANNKKYRANNILLFLLNLLL
jgi:hypothetical protein